MLGSSHLCSRLSKSTISRHSTGPIIARRQHSSCRPHSTAANIPAWPFCSPPWPSPFAALCIWLTVRIVNRRERWAKWTQAVVVGIPVLYVLSFGPACWFTSPSGNMSDGAFDVRFATSTGVIISGYSRQTRSAIYRPLFSVASHEGRFGDLLRWYICLHKDDGVVPLYYPDSIDWIVQKSKN
ncbi:MAG: hypothetical protein HY290_25480 [Planctomycetia bacterium]|nr:hypothetical protein [Planctomycetia bacterium]